MPINITPLDLEEVTQSKPRDERSDSWVHHPPHRTGPSHSGNKHKKKNAHPFRGEHSIIIIKD